MTGRPCGKCRIGKVPMAQMCEQCQAHRRARKRAVGYDKRVADVRRAAKQCSQCSRPFLPDTTMCARHTLESRLSARKRRGYEGRLWALKYTDDELRAIIRHEDNEKKPKAEAVESK